MSKEEKEAFVTGHSGTTAGEVLLVCISAPLGTAAFRCSPWRGRVAEFLVIWLPMLVCQTQWLYPHGVGLLTLQAGAVAYRYMNAKSKYGSSIKYRKPKSLVKSEKKDEPRRLLNFVTMYRSSLLLLTFIAILAVDFRIFPRRFCKAEVDGYGLMDVGAASFIIAAGLVASKPRHRPKPLQRSIGSLVPLVLLGTIRLVTNKGIEYQEHVSEYGVHWNFFYTLAVINTVGPLIRVLHPKPNWYMPILVMAGYQYWLSFGSGQKFIEVFPRSCEQLESAEVPLPWFILASCNVLAANREGIFGCMGYLALFQAAEWIGRVCLWGRRPGGLAICASLLWLVHGLLVIVLGIPISRRSTNAGFCTWALAHNVTLLWMTQIAVKDVRSEREPVLPPILDAMNRHGLLMFVIANLLTGLINLTVPTMGAADFEAMGYLAIYLGAVACTALALDKVWGAKAQVKGLKID